MTESWFTRVFRALRVDRNSPLSFASPRVSPAPQTRPRGLQQAAASCRKLTVYSHFLETSADYPDFFCSQMYFHRIYFFVLQFFKHASFAALPLVPAQIRNPEIHSLKSGVLWVVNNAVIFVCGSVELCILTGETDREERLCVDLKAAD